MTTHEAHATYDAIIIGSGIGGLTSASLLAQLGGKKVLVLERHSKLGGFTHVFSRGKKYTWDVGVHYVGQMTPGNPGHDVLALVSGGRIRWNKMPDPFEVYVYPGMTFQQPAGREAFLESLSALFPEEVPALRQYLKDLGRANRAFGLRAAFADLAPENRLFSWLGDILTRNGSRLALQTTQQYLDTHFRDKRLKALLISQWGDYGLPPNESAFVLHAMIAEHYLEGGYYPAKGSEDIADSIQQVITQHGGTCLTRHEVIEILAENGKATGVRVREKRPSPDLGAPAELTFHAPLILSDAGATLTYTRLLPEDAHPALPEIRKDLEALSRSPAHLNLFLALKKDPRELGFKGENHWIYESYDHNRLFNEKNSAVEGKPAFAYLSFPSLKKSEAQTHTAEVITTVDFAPFEQWKDTQCRNRGEPYLEFKERITHGLLDLIEKHYPGFRENVEYSELSTPLTTEHYTAHPRGMLYGLPGRPERYRWKWARCGTPIQGLLLTGADAVAHGVMGATMGGVIAAAKAMGGFRAMGRIMSAAKKASQIA